MGLGTILLKYNVTYTKMVSKHRSLSCGAVLTAKKKSSGSVAGGGGGAAGEGEVLEGSHADCQAPAWPTASRPWHWHSKSSIAQMQVLVGSGLRFVLPSAVWVQDGWGEV